MYLPASKVQSCFFPNKYGNCVFLFNIMKSDSEQSVSNLGYIFFLISS